MAEQPGRWRARWIWFRPPPDSGDEWGTRPRETGDVFGLLRHAFDLPRVPSSARCRVTADARYVLYVNGIRIGAGPVRSQPEILTYDTYDLAPHLRAGPNVVAAIVRRYGRPTTAWRPGEPAGETGYGSFAFEADLDGMVVSSDDTWRGRGAHISSVEPSAASGALVPPPTEGPPPIEIADLREEPAGWTEPGFDDSDWSPAVVLGPGGIGTHEPEPPSPFALALSRPIPPPTERLVVPRALTGRGVAARTPDEHPLTALRNDDAGSPAGSPAPPAGEPVALRAGEWATFDFCEIVCAHPVVTLDAEPGTVVDLACGEDLGDDMRPVTAPREWAMRAVAAGGGTEKVEAFEPVSFRWLSIAVRAGEARVDLRAHERLTPRVAGAAFACSDPLLERIWAAGVRTLDLCSLDAFVDCPGREQRAWLGDAYLSTVLSLIVNPDASMPAWNLRLHGAGARPDGLLPMVAAGDFSVRRATIPDFTLLWILGLAELYERTGDAALVAEQLPVAERALGFFEGFRGATGLLVDVPGWVFIDWAQLERGPSLAALDAFHVLALDAFARLATVAGNDGSAERALANAARTREAFAAYWDPSRGVFVDCLGGRRVSQQTNAVAILAGCAPEQSWPVMLDRILEDGRLVRTRTPGDPGTFAQRIASQFVPPDAFDDDEHVVEAQPYFAHFLHKAMVRAGRGGEVHESIRRWRGMVERGNGCLQEHWTAEPGLSSRCHAWSGTPVHDLATYTLGVRPAEPGMRAVVVEPALGDLEWAEGAVATPHGFVRVRAKRGAEPVVEAPAGVRVIVPPLGSTPAEGRGT